jgi:Tfp pilus assembly protein PilX
MNPLPASSRPRSRQSLRGSRGAVLMVSLLFATIIAVAITSYLSLTRTAMTISQRALCNNAAVNLAETGLEEAMWSINQNVAGDAAAWSGWSVTAANTATRKFTGFDIGQGVTGVVRVYVSNTLTSGAAPFVVSRASVTLPNNRGTVEKYLKVTLALRSTFANGLVAKRTISFAGNTASVDSYNSKKGSYNADLGGGAFNKNDKGSAGSLAVTMDSLSVGNADIWGHVAVGTSDTSGLSVGSNGTVGPFGTAAGTVVASAVTTNFTANFDDTTAPTTSGYTIASVGAETLPRGGDVAAADGKFYYYVGGISISGNDSKVLHIADNKKVVIVLTPTTGTAVDIKGNASIQLDGSTSTLEMYAEADVSIAGNGAVNSGNPVNFKLYGTRAASAASKQTIAISGNGNLSAVVYAPNAALSIKGGGTSGSVYGAMIGDTITVTGNDAFHYDEALADLTEGSPFGISKWDELTSSTDRDAVSAYVSFY